MLETLSIRNYVLISELTINFSTGLSAITGETGSGKSIILGALSLILGEKCKGDVIRSGEKESVLTALFSLKDSSLALSYLKRLEIEVEDGEVTIQRIIKESGRSLMYVNGRSVSRSELETLGAYLVEISSQHAHQSLLKSENQRDMLDEFARNGGEREVYSKAYEEYKAKKRELENLKEEAEKSLAEYDYLSFCLKELEEAELKECEDEELSDEVKRISSAESLKASLDSVQVYLRGEAAEGAISLLSKAEAELSKASRADDALSSFLPRLEEISIEAEDISESLRDYLSSLSYSEAELEAKQERLARLQRIKRKYGPSLTEAIKKRDEYKRKIDYADNFEDAIKDASAALEGALATLKNAAALLTTSRNASAKLLEKEVLEVLSELGMKEANFEIKLDSVPYNPFGADKVDFLIAANKGEKEGEISQIASGGELSRIMLALKASLSNENGPDSLIFDEVDAGIGGVVANNVAKELKKLASEHQVIVITHLPQIAVKADLQLVVSKSVKDERTFTSVKTVEGEERVMEIARLLSGESGEQAIKHARYLLAEV